ncbi:odontogenesis associated phosphoprotein [Peromyscus maniculatus bairdii]|uniref:Odontogenesis associated phosphoprotein n=1 Tax=Peromyscus maniculatus bairdii TaxID=230844 RepID=A0A6I9MDQ8_PERMB|nr:odontogenesis associated phosphoprotein [Peromyscus maniculatus bairdii]
MAPGFHFWVLVCWLVVTMAEGQDVVTPPNNVNPTDCQIFPLTPPPPSTRKPTVTRVQANPRTPGWVWLYFPPRRPGFYPRLPNGPFLLPNYNHRFPFRPFFPPRGGPNAGRYFLGGLLQSRSSSEESVEK